MRRTRDVWDPGGSSPRVRGKHSGGRRKLGAGRLIPACAGKTMRVSRSMSRVAAHPRVCGENQQVLLTGLPKWGSSPRVRGKPPSLIGSCSSIRLIPACAGKTSTRRSGDTPARAHPRVCGENGPCHAHGLEHVGSSPRVRGKPDTATEWMRARGLIPACAGKTPPSEAASTSWPAHPRVCGENDNMPMRRITDWGSSPRVRGKLRAPICSLKPFGLIPACAGKTARRRPRGCGGWAHPRVCGENCPCRPLSDAERGSSPRVRGKLHTMYFLHSTGGLIPACAGKTRGRKPSSVMVGAHPRVCGENGS